MEEREKDVQRGMRKQHELDHDGQSYDVHMEKRPLGIANSSNENSKLTDSVCGGRVRVIGGRYGDLRDQDGRASDGESNWVELHGLASVFRNGLWVYAIIVCSFAAPLALPLRSSCVRIFAIPSARRNHRR